MTGFEAAAVAARMVAGADFIGPGFPRDLASAAPLTMPVSITIKADLTTRDVRQTLSMITNRAGRSLRERRLRGCLVAHRGYGMIFLDADEEALVRFALAHELAHFVGHYLARRELAIARLGHEIVEVLDGQRPPTAQERLAGILSSCPLGVFGDLMERNGGSPLSSAAEIMEYEADEAAFLALAPVGVVIRLTIQNSGQIDRPSVVQALVEEFGLSPNDANRHAPRVMNAVARGRPSLVDQLKETASQVMHGRPH